MPRRFVQPAVLAAATLLALGVPPARAAPATDEYGYLDSTARCAAPNVAVVFGATSTSRVAVCKATNGELQYRGVRVADGAKLFLSATRAADGSYRATNDGIDYAVTSKTLTISSGGKTVRDESWVDFHGPATGQPSAASSASNPAAPPPTPSAQPSATSTVPLPPPLPAEVGGR